MGAWGPGLYQNDISEDVKNYFCDQLRRGKCTDFITKELMDSYQDAITDSEDAPNFWFALADVQWDMGRLLPEVKDQAIFYLQSSQNCLFEDQFSKKNAARRREVLDKLLKKLNSPSPPKKKITPYRLYRCPWKKGDVFALPLESNLAHKLGVNGNYLLLEMVSEREYHPGHIIPVMYIKISQDKNLPDNLDQYNSLRYIKIFSQRIDGIQLKEYALSDHSDAAGMIRSIDENGYQTMYRISLITTSARSVPTKLVYLGNYSGATHPQKEYIPPWDVNIPAYAWMDVEEAILRKYCNQMEA